MVAGGCLLAKVSWSIVRDFVIWRGPRFFLEDEMLFAARHPDVLVLIGRTTCLVSFLLSFSLSSPSLPRSALQLLTDPLSPSQTSNPLPSQANS